jgi:hypothetical protein
VGEANETPEDGGPQRPAVSRSFVVASRILLLLVAAGALVAAVAIGLRGRGGGQSHATARYVCPMHPEVRAAAPGLCPICRMALEPLSGSAAADPTSRSQMAGMADLTAVENVRKHKIFDVMRRHSLLFNLRELRGPAWVEDDHAVTAIFYNDQIEALDADEPGSLSLTQAPQATFAVRRTADAAIPWDRSTSRIRFRFVTQAGGRAAPPPRPGQVGWLELSRKVRDVAGVAASAVMQSPEGPYVLVPGAGFSFEKRHIEIGETFLKQGFAVVLSGLRLHDVVVSKATFFVDADRRLGNRAGEAGWAAP